MSGMTSIDGVQTRIEAAIPDLKLQIWRNDSPSGQHAFIVPSAFALPVARFVRDEPAFQFDYLSSVTGVDWLDSTRKDKVKIRKLVDGVETEVEEVRETRVPGFLEAVYHLYSVSHKQGPLILRLRTANRTDQVAIPSLTPVYRGAEFQEREIYDLYGIVFSGHPDLRRIFMWDEFAHHPMRKDYSQPDDYEYEPTPHDQILERARRHYPVDQPK